MSTVSEQISNLAPDEKRKLVARLLRQRAGEAVSFHSLSQGQRSLWFEAKLFPQSTAYNITFAARIISSFDPQLLQRGFQMLVDRHPSLRTTFATRGEEPVQAIHAFMPVEFEVVEASSRSGNELKADLLQASAQPFDLERGPLMRVSLFTRAAEQSILLLTVHHLIGDFWSLVIMMEELARWYAAESKSNHIDLPTGQLQYIDYVNWQAEMLAGPEGERLWSYWKEKLAGELPNINLPADKPRSPIQTHRGASHTFKLDRDLSNKLKEFVKLESTTPYVVVLAAFQCLLHRYSGQNEILVGSPAAGRDRAGLAEVVGYFANPVVMRTDFSGNPSFRELLQNVRQTVLEAMEHEMFPFPVLVERLRPARDLSSSPLFQVMFVLERSHRTSLEGASLFIMGEPGARLDLSGLVLESFDLKPQTVQFDLTLMLESVNETFVAALQYSTDLFEAETIERMAGHLQVLLEAVVVNGDTRVQELPLLTAVEREQLVQSWNDTACLCPSEESVAQSFEAQVKANAAAIAVEYEGRELSYGELNERANQLAHELRRLGVTAETHVGICLERSEQMLIAVLGIWKAGGAYVPLDPQYPEARLQFMVADAQLQVLVTEAGQVEKLQCEGVTVLCLEQEQARLAQQSRENPEPIVNGAHLAYMIYTSGSTGQPKGVQITHRALQNFLATMLTEPGLTETDRMLAVTTLSFDIAGLELYLPLLVGARVIVASRRQASDGQELRRRLSAGGVTVMQATPATWRMLLENGWDGAEPLKVLCGGEALPAELSAALVQRSASVWNLYGPTETTIWSTVSRVRDTGEVVIGKPIGNTQVYVLDESGGLAPVGAAGELYIGGAGLARGYWQRAELTAEKFVPDGVSGRSGERLYRTGDLVKWRRDGELEYLGRLDQQVKVRGYRIELSEIEAALREFPELSDVVAVVQGDAGDERRLVAFLVSTQANEELSATEIRERLKLRLPEYMIPNAFVFLPALPLTPNGKVDRKALPAAVQRSAATYLAPRTATEEIVAGIWSSVLKVAQVGVTDNFFDLGGHSLLATQVMSRITASFGVELPLAVMFQAPTVAGLSRQVDSARAAEPLSRAVRPSFRRTGTEVLPLSFAQQRLWFLDQFEEESALYNIPAAFRIEGAFDEQLLERSLNEIIRRHEVLRTRFENRDGQPVQVIDQTLHLTVEKLDLTTRKAEEREAHARKLAAVEAREPFDLRRGPLLRVKVLRLGPAQHLLLVAMHHIMSDGWSIGVLIKELGTIYEAYSRGEESPLPELTLQYADYALWQREWLQGEALDEQLHYWREKLAGAPAVLELPTDKPRPSVQTFRGGVQSFVVRSELAESLKQLSRREGVTLFMTLLATFEILLSRYSGQKDFCVGSAIANRNREEIEKLIGFFVNTLVLRADLNGNPTVRELLLRVREVALDAYAHQDVPFEKLVEELQPVRALGHSPLFQVLLLLHNAPLPNMKLLDATLSPVEIHSETSKFDLVVSAMEFAGELKITIEYSTDLFDAETIERMAGHLQVLLEAVVANGERRVQELPLLTTTEREELVQSWNDTACLYPSEESVAQSFEAQVKANATAIAVEYEGRELSYGELNERANQLAHELRRLGVKAETHVGICLERSEQMLIAVLGIWKAGGAYVPLDPQYPEARLQFMVADAQLKVLVTEAEQVEKLQCEGVTVLCLEREQARLAQQSRESPEPIVNGGHLAYMIYTSGSTGQPKGVQITHRALQNFLATMLTEPGLTETDQMLAVTTLSFDIAGLELYLPLLVGARVIVASRRQASDGQELRRRLSAGGVTVMQATPATWRMLLESGWEGAEPLKVLCGGEALPPELSAALVQRSASVWNLYGPTETTIWSTVSRVRDTGEVVIGKPIGNTQVYVLDESGGLAPVGAAGELHIGGAGLARGYWQRAELTAEKFVPDGVSGRSGERLYRTGDLVKWRRAGELEYLGRLDQQVKVRGYRIELSEIEAILKRHSGVKDAVAIAYDDGSQDKRLVAYVVQNSQPGIELGKNDGPSWHTEQVEQWQTLWHETYLQNSGNQDPTLNFNGWNSSYNGQPIPFEEMHEWVTCTTDRILSLRPRRILEIGCGTGLLLFRLAPHSLEYLGTDFSEQALNYIRRQLRPDWSNCKLSQRNADDFSDLNPQHYDLVILNSVIQYFPSVDYLMRVLEGAIKSVAPGGSIFIGDVRSLPLLELFHASVLLQQSPASLPAADLRRRLRKRVTEEEELLLDPEFFAVLKEQFPQIGSIELQLKRGHHLNELTRYRYDVVLRIQTETAPPLAAPTYDWQDEELTLDTLRRRLVATTPAVVRVTRIPNARIQADIKSLGLIKQAADHETVGELRNAAAAVSEGVDPESVWSIATDLPYQVELTYTGDGANGNFEAVFKHRDATAAHAIASPKQNGQRTRRTLGAYANNPLRGAYARKLVVQLRALAKESLPDYMVPSAFVLLDELPLTPNGKVNRRALPHPDSLRAHSELGYVAPRTELERSIASVWQQVLQVEKVGLHDNFFDLGGHSLLMAQVRSRLRVILDRDVSMVEMFQYPTITSLATYLSEGKTEGVAFQSGRARAKKRLEAARETSREIAIVGMAARFPGAENVDKFWTNLRDGVESVSFFSVEELVAAGVDSTLLSHPNYVKAGVMLEGADLFDARFFGFNPREVEMMDPQHRLFLECSWEALEDAGYDSEQYEGAIGVFGGASMNTYLLNVFPEQGLNVSEEAFQVMMGNDKDYLTTRASYKLNLKGPSLSVQTACSTSLVVIHLACQSILNGECEMALAGGVCVRTPLKTGYLYQPDGIASRDGHCRAFDANASGTIFGSGVGLIVLKRLKDALADRDNIYAVIKGSAINNDGSEKIGYTGPSFERQAAVLAEAINVAEVEPESVSYIEAHGTGTSLGDPVEVAALGEVFGGHGRGTNSCGIGSVKTNVGHLDAAAGVAGVIKTVLALRHQQLPPSLNFDEANPQIDFAGNTFFVNSRLREWKTNGIPRRAGVSSFGIGGTNAHIILEEAPVVMPKSAEESTRSTKLLLLSAKTSSALEAATKNLAAHLKQLPDTNLDDVVYTLKVGRRRFAYRRAVVCHDLQDAVEALETCSPERVQSQWQEAVNPPIVFMFPGQGTQYVNMAAGLYRTEPVFKEVVDHCCKVVKPQLGLDLRTVLFLEEREADAAAKQLTQTWITQPALFVIEYALAKLWMSWGVRPQAMIGHSIGEYVAACLANVFSSDDALSLVATRARLMQSVAGGAMLSVVSSEDALTPLLSEQLAIAAVNGPSNCVVSGSTAEIEKLELVLQSRGIDHRRLHVSHAFHSASMDAILDSFTEQVQAIRLNPPEAPFVSNLTGTWITDAEARSAAYWTAHLRHTVRFSAGLTELLQDPARVFLEVGPGASLNQLLRQQKTWTSKRVGLASLRSVRDREADEQFLQRTVGKLWLAGARFDWSGFYAQEDRRRLSLPVYPFERQRYWVEPQRPIKRTEISGNGSHAVQIDDSLHHRPELAVSYQPAGNEIERKLALIWQQLLGIESIGSNDDFFELGGHSLLATQVATRIRSAFNIELPVGTLFELPTIRKLAPLILTKLCERTEAEELEQMLAAIRNLSALEVQGMLAAERAVH